LSLCHQHLIETQLVMCSHCEVVHLGIDVLQELVCGMNLFANFVVYPYLILDDISERGLISAEILPITTLPMVGEWETGLVPSSIKVEGPKKTIRGGKGGIRANQNFSKEFDLCSKIDPTRHSYNSVKST
jgi:hypothetical protein